MPKSVLKEWDKLPKMLTKMGIMEEEPTYFFVCGNSEDNQTLDTIRQEKVATEHIPNKDLYIEWQDHNLDHPEHMQAILSIFSPPGATGYYAEYRGFGKKEQSLKITFYKIFM